jgi:hypothetical protein
MMMMMMQPKSRLPVAAKEKAAIRIRTRIYCGGSSVAATPLHVVFQTAAVQMDVSFFCQLFSH